MPNGATVSTAAGVAATGAAGFGTVVLMLMPAAEAAWSAQDMPASDLLFWQHPTQDTIWAGSM